MARKHKKVSIPSSGRKWYHKGYKFGYAAGTRKAANGVRLKSIPHPGVELSKGALENAEIDIPVKPNYEAAKWQGFTEAMSLIIASKR